MSTIDALVSVIMSTYNERVDWVEKSINSILNQTYRNIEFIIVVDSPTNIEVINLITKYQNLDPRVKVFINNENKGLVESLNLALKYCQGKYIARMDADDISCKNRLSYQKEFLEKKI